MGLLIAAVLMIVALVLGWLSTQLTTSLLDARARSVGLVAAGALTSEVDSADYASARRTLMAVKDDPEVVQATLYDLSGRIVASTNRSLEGKRTAGDIQRLATSDQPAMLHRSVEGVDVLESWTPVVVGNRRSAAVSVAFAGAAFERQLWFIRIMVFGILLLGVVAAIGVAMLAASGIARPITELAEVSRALAGGDLTVGFEAPGGAPREVESLFEDFQLLVRQLRELISEAQTVGAQLETSSRDILQRSDEEASGATQQASSLTQTSATLEQLAATTQAIATQAKSVAELATMVQQSVESGQGAVGTARDRMEEIRVGSQESAHQAEELADASRRISEVVGIINEIARRTKILAVNAAIEAARAQELGAGFNVVAVEVRQLADSVVESTKQIETTMADFAGAIKGIVSVTELQEQRVEEGADQIEAAARAMGEIEGLAQKAANAAQEISFGAQQQQAGSDQVVSAVREVANVAQTFAQASRSNQTAAAALAGLTDRILTIVRRFRLG